MTLTEPAITGQVHDDRDEGHRGPLSGVRPELHDLVSLLAHGYARMPLFA